MKIETRNNASSTTTHVESFIFSGGEIQVRVRDIKINTDSTVIITTRLTSSDAIMELLMAVDAIRQIQPTVSIELIAAYFPYARQDRVCASGEAMSLKVMTGLINNLHLSKVTVTDAHSDVTTALLNNVNHVEQASVIARNEKLVSELQSGKLTVIAPDAGASKKSLLLAVLNNAPFVQALKVRNPETGRIEATEIMGDVTGKNVLITDDICDGGATFIALANALKAKGANTISLFITHGIFSKGLSVFDGLIDNIYTTDSFRRADAFEQHASLSITSL